ncbi:DUF1223 domain-containing protein [Amorphus sp. 3PC139-8]|uniref:DUF1223 domain-containing protein n=1 Tax=Amorphus sp. 3PC139-8 TaxID=2735676 RepID=UPI00345C7987
MLRHKAALFVGCALLAGSVTAHAESAYVGRPVVELFTSQGCSSCPPADRLVGRLAEEGRVIALTYPVTLWDYLGWTDTLATRENSERQFAYSQARGDGAIYTPQIVVNGREDVVGNKEADVLRELDRQRATGGFPSVEVDAVRQGGVLHVQVHAAGGYSGKQATIWLGHVLREVPVAIDRGENSGRKIVYHNVVQSLRPIGMWSGKEVEIDLPVNELARDGESACVVLVQLDGKEGPGPIVGAAMASWPLTRANALVRE